MRTALILALAGSLAINPAVAAAGSTSQLSGVWQGTLGEQPIRACFNEEVGYGIYYYQSHLKQIGLQQPDSDRAQFVEGGDADDSKAPRWSFDRIAAGALSGSWTQGKKTLPIVLKRVPVQLSEDESACGSMAFQGPRLAGVTTISKPAVKDGFHYTRLILDLRGHFEDVSVETFALDGDSPAAKRINAKLAEPLDSKRDDSWFACVRMAGDTEPNGAQSIESYEPRMVTPRWLSVRQHWDGFCGGAHPDSADTPMLFDRTSGDEVDPRSWFNARAFKREKVDKDVLVSILPPLKSAILQGWRPSDEECDSPMREQEFWDVELTRTGFVFTAELPHVAAACGEEFKMSFARAAPFLNDEGKRQVAALQTESAGKH